MKQSSFTLGITWITISNSLLAVTAWSTASVNSPANRKVVCTSCRPLRQNRHLQHYRLWHDYNHFLLRHTRHGGHDILPRVHGSSKSSLETNMVVDNENNTIPSSSRYPGGEVIGSTGKIGSYLLHRLNQKAPTLLKQNAHPSSSYSQSLNAAATPRGVAPGCLSPPNTPIYACIPSSSIRDVWEATLPHRRKDLVFICNCVPSRHLNLASTTPTSTTTTTTTDNENFTIVVPHFGVPHTKLTTNKTLLTPQVNTSPQSPPTVIYGKHATTLASLLRKDGIPVSVAQHPYEVQVAATRKLVWASVMWLLCHDHASNNVDGVVFIDKKEEPVTVKQVHEFKTTLLERLVEEILPALERLASEWSDCSNNDDKIDNDVTTIASSLQTIGSVRDIVNYLESYSMSISNGNVIPSKDLALREIRERNGLLLSLLMASSPNMKQGSMDSIHMCLIRRVAGEEILSQCLTIQHGNAGKDADRDKSVQRVRCVASDFEFLIHPTSSAFDTNTPLTMSNQKDAAKSVVVIGAGMVGSSIACHLSQRGVNVTVLDQRSNLLPTAINDDIDPGVATSSTFAWLNANDKSPLSYMQLNQLGMEVWRRHDVLKGLPVWCGCLLRKTREKDEEVGAERLLALEQARSHYSCIGPLNMEEARLLEPGVAFNKNGNGQENHCTNESLRESKHHEIKSDLVKSEEIYFYPEEGHVDPVDAVRALRLSAQSNGVRFLGGAQIHGIIHDDDNIVIGIEYYAHENSETINFLATDMVVVAAGANSSIPLLGIGSNRLPLLNQPGVLAYTKIPHDAPAEETNEVENNRMLQRIFVDTISHSHILRRPDGTLVIGGGQLVLGGTDDTCLDKQQPTSLSSSEEDDSTIGETMVQTLTNAIAPFELMSSKGKHTNKSVRITRANRPMPKDGLPVVGLVEPGLFVAVSHSAMTLGLLLGELSAYEVWNIIETQHEINNTKKYGFKILDDYRPSRFWMKT